jgi:hypothetical protein
MREHRRRRVDRAPLPTAQSVCPAAKALLAFAFLDGSLDVADDIKRDPVQVSGGPHEEPGTPRSPWRATPISRRTSAFPVLDSPFSSFPIETKSGS